MSFRRRVDAFYEYCSVMESLIARYHISPIAHGWKKTRLIIAIYMALSFNPLERLRRLKSYDRGVETWDNFKSLYYPVLLVSLGFSAWMLLWRISLPMWLIIQKAPVTTPESCSEIIGVSVIWLLLIYVVEHEVMSALFESDVFRLVNKLKPQYKERLGFPQK